MFSVGLCVSMYACVCELASICSYVDPSIDSFLYVCMYVGVKIKKITAAHHETENETRKN